MAEKRKGGDLWHGCYAGGRGDLFTPESNRHPAKMAVALCYRIFEHGRKMGYWKPGDVILDPMSGIGTTLVVGYSLGYNVIGVELEEHFVRLLALNMVRCVAKLGAQGWFRIVQGDARRLREVLSCQPPVASAVTSPPYAGDAPKRDSADHNERTQENAGREGKHQKLGVSLRGSGYSGAVTSPPYGEALQSEHGIDLSKVKRTGGPHSQSRLASNYSGAISSPPYLDSDGRKHDGQLNGVDVRQNFAARSTTAAQIGNLRDPKGDIEKQLSVASCQLPAKQETYLSAMLTVYRELHAVLKPAGVVCLVTKNPVKAGAIRRLDADTIRLMEAAGFALIERKMAMLSEDLGEQRRFDGGTDKVRRERKSFFKRLFERKRPDLRVDHEDVMFFRKV